MKADDLLNQLQARGIIVSLAGDDLSVTPWSLLTDDDRQAIRANKDELVALLDRPPADSDCPISIEIEGASVPAPEGAPPVTTTRSYEVARVLEDIDRKLTAIKNTEQTNQAVAVGWGLAARIRHDSEKQCPIAFDLQGVSELDELLTDIESTLGLEERRSPNMSLSNAFWEWSLRASHKEQ